MTLHVKNRIHLPPSLSLLVNARAEAQGCKPATVVKECVMAFASLPVDVRRCHLHEFHWSNLASGGWEPFFLDADALRMAGSAKIGAWSRDQLIIASVGWYLLAW